MLLVKGVSLLREANTLQPQLDWHWFAAVAAPLIGGLKARFIFNKSCRNNLKRIAALKRPKIWQFFRPGFFLALAAMITLGATLSTLADNNYSLLIAVGLLDLSIAVALLGSSYVFWIKRALLK